MFFDVRIFHHGAKSNQLAIVEAAFKKQEDEKIGCIIDVEKATFTPLVYTTVEQNFNFSRINTWWNLT